MKDGGMEQAIESLATITAEQVKFHDSLTSMFSELVDLNNPDIDALFDKYEVSVTGKYPRKEG